MASAITSMVWSDEATLLVGYADGTCVELTESYVGRSVNASAPQIYAFASLSVGSVYATEIADLKSGVKYYFRVAARTAPAFSGRAGGGDDDYLVSPWSTGAALGARSGSPYS